MFNTVYTVLLILKGWNISIHWFRWGRHKEKETKILEDKWWNQGCIYYILSIPVYIPDETKKVLENGIILLLSVRLYWIHKQTTVYFK